MYFDKAKLVTFNCTHFVSLTHPFLSLSSSAFYFYVKVGFLKDLHTLQ